MLRFPLLASALVAGFASGCAIDVDPIDPIGERQQAARICAAGATVEGIDVSRWQSTVNWTQVKAAGKQFAIASVGHGLYEDVQFDANWRGMKAAGLIRGAYQFFSPGDDPIVQADILIRRVGMLEPDDLPVVIDVEETDGLTPAVIATRVKIWIDRVEAALGKPVMIYTGKYFWNDNVKTADHAGNPLWIAAYNVTCPDTPLVWDRWKFWQYSNTGRVAGISGDVDLNKWNGTLADLLAFARAPSGHPFAARYVSQSFPPARTAFQLRAGERLAAHIELQNVGTRSWDASTHLATSEPRDRPSVFADDSWIAPDRPAAVTGTVAPGTSHRFEFVFHAPDVPGIYHEHFNLVHEGEAWFSDPGQGGPPDGQLEAQIEVLPGLTPPTPPTPTPTPIDPIPTPEPGMVDPPGPTDPGAEAAGCATTAARERPLSGSVLVGFGLLLLALSLRRLRS